MTVNCMSARSGDGRPETTLNRSFGAGQPFLTSLRELRVVSRGRALRPRVAHGARSLLMHRLMSSSGGFLAGLGVNCRVVYRRRRRLVSVGLEVCLMAHLRSYAALNGSKWQRAASSKEAPGKHAATRAAWAEFGPPAKNSLERCCESSRDRAGRGDSVRGVDTVACEFSDGARLRRAVTSQPGPEVWL